MVRNISTLKHLQLMFNFSAIPRRDSVVSALAPRFAGDNILVLSSASTVVPATRVSVVLTHWNRTCVRFIYFSTLTCTNVRSLQDSIVTALTESGDGVLSPSGGSVLEEAEPLLPSLVPDIQQIPVSGRDLVINFHSTAYSCRPQIISKKKPRKFSTLVLIVSLGSLLAQYSQRSQMYRSIQQKHNMGLAAKDEHNLTSRKGVSAEFSRTHCLKLWGDGSTPSNVS